MSLLSDTTRIKNHRTRYFTPENVYGQKGQGGMADLSETPQSDVAKIGQLWGDWSQCARDLGQKWKVRPCISLASGVETTILDTSGPARITHIWMTMDPKYYRDIILRMYWDGEAFPSVEVPIGDFFCCAWLKPLKIFSMPINVNPIGGMNCYFPMPFRQGARITVENRLPKKYECFFYSISVEEGPVADDEAYFHASFHRENPVQYGTDYTIVDNIRGCGHYIGTHISWQQNSNCWWGEGEFKAFLDQDGEFPSYCGTGTEDYFGGAWGFTENYSAPFLGYQDLSAQGLFGEKRATNSVGNRHSMYRFHIPDPIRFQTDFKATIQALGWRSEERYLPLMEDISSVCYWYQSEPHVKFEKLGTRDELEII